MGCAAIITRGLASLSVVLLGLFTARSSDASENATQRSAAVRSHWAFLPVAPVDPPAVKETQWVQTPIDRFILAKLEKEGLQPAPRGDKETLIRRATYDLTGLPPKPEEVAAFLADSSADAFDKIVERLLNSPRYGEQWGRHWLDVARYADNKGYVFFEEKSYPWAWVYRDYVVAAFNDDKPYNRFIREQLSADQMNLSGDERAAAALGFLTVGDHFSNNTHDIIDDRIDVVCRGLLGLTVSCARCHDHKFDPIKMSDYYSLYSVFRSSTEPAIAPAVEPLALNEGSEGFEVELIAREQKLRRFVETKHAAILKDARGRIAEYLMAAYAQRNQPSTDNFMLLAEKGDLHPEVIARWRTFLEQGEPTNSVWAPWMALARLSEDEFASKAAGLLEATAHEVQLNPLVAAKFARVNLATMKDVADGYASLLAQVNEHWREASAQPGCLQLSDPAEEELRAALYGANAPCDVPAEMDWGFISLLPDRTGQAEFQRLIRDLEQWLMNGPGAPARAMILQDRPVPYRARLFRRGNPNQLGPLIPRQFLSFLDARPLDHGSGRAQLAEAIVDPKNPLTARVWVNRVWLHHFGAGLVATPSDFGMRSDAPTHPELLDWLAREFVRGGWRTKELHRLIMKSAVYQQASVVENNSNNAKNSLALAEERDPENRWLWRMNRSRHTFETQRDALLAVAGRLDMRLGGPPEDLNGSRRTLYTFINRMDVAPVRTTFDFPNPSTTCPQRARTTVAPQALYLMNNDFVDDCAKELAGRPDVAELKEARGKVKRLYELLFSRSPTTSELNRALEFLGASPAAQDWQHYAHALLLLNEFVFVD